MHQPIYSESTVVVTFAKVIMPIWFWLILLNRGQFLTKISCTNAAGRLSMALNSLIK